jgi:hypothetical protein
LLSRGDGSKSPYLHLLIRTSHISGGLNSKQCTMQLGLGNIDRTHEVQVVRSRLYTLRKLYPIGLLPSSALRANGHGVAVLRGHGPI